MREHLYTLILRNKQGNEILSFDFETDRDAALIKFYDLLEVVKKSSELVLYEDYETSHERKFLTNKEK